MAMWQLNAPESYNGLPDVAQFVNYLNTLDGQEKNTFFAPGEIFLGRAPGRLDVMGGIADYSGSLVLELPLALATFVAAQSIDAPLLQIHSSEGKVNIPLSVLLECQSYEEARSLLNREPKDSWVAYLAGVWLVLVRELGLSPKQGVKLLVYSEVPVGKGVSSSAALEVATLMALSGVYNLQIEGPAAAILCQKAENLVVGAPCGIMDQMTSSCGEAGKLLALLCQQAELETPVELPSELEVWGIDSGIRHAVSGADYGSVRVGAFMGYRIIAELAGLTVRKTGEGKVSFEDNRWKGYLANLTPSEWETYYCDRLPLTIEGAEFLARYGGISDPVTKVDPARTYAVREPTAHPIYEHYRVGLFRQLLQAQPLETKTLELLGELMYQSHASYSRCGLGSSGTDRLVELVRQVGPAGGLYGAKITGGGSGGTVAVLARRGAQEAVEEVAHRYYGEKGLPFTPLIGGSSTGATRFGVARLSFVD
jgi:L-arabinokinase